MSTLQVANVHFETTGANRIEYTGNNIIRVQANGGFQLPAGTTAQRPTGALNSVLRFNTDTGFLERHKAQLRPREWDEAERQSLLAVAASVSPESHANALPEVYAAMGAWRNGAH